MEVVRIIDETLEAFFLLPIPMHPALLPELMGGLDKCVHNYTIKAISGCGKCSTPHIYAIFMQKFMGSVFFGP